MSYTLETPHLIIQSDLICHNKHAVNSNTITSNTHLRLARRWPLSPQLPPVAQARRLNKKIRHATYQLLLPDNWKLIHLVFNQDLLTPFNKASYATQSKPHPPPPEIIGNELKYEVQQILDAHRCQNTIKFLVSWKVLRRQAWATGSSWGESGQRRASLKGAVRASLRQLFDVEGKCG